MSKQVLKELAKKHSTRTEQNGIITISVDDKKVLEEYKNKL